MRQAALPRHLHRLAARVAAARERGGTAMVLPAPAASAAPASRPAAAALAMDSAAERREPARNVARAPDPAGKFWEPVMTSLPRLRPRRAKAEVAPRAVGPASPRPKQELAAH